MAELEDVRSGLVLGLGCERGADPAEIIALAETALARCGRSAADVALVASIKARASEPAIAAAARHFDAPLMFFSASTLEALTPRLVHPSDIVFAHTGCHGVAEAAALAGGGDAAELIVPKLKSRQATVAIAESSQSVAVAGSRDESALAVTSTSRMHALASPPRGEDACRADEGVFPPALSQLSPSSGGARHLLPAGERGQQAATIRNFESARP